MIEKVKPIPQIDIGVSSDRVIIFPDDPEQKTHGGIIIPDTAQTKTFKGRVKVVGPGDEEHPIPRWIKPGAYVCYGKYAGSEYNCRGNEFLIMRVGDIIGPVLDLY